MPVLTSTCSQMLLMTLQTSKQTKKTMTRYGVRQLKMTCKMHATCKGNLGVGEHWWTCTHGHTQLLTSWSSLVLSWEFVRLLDSRAAASSWFRLYHVHTCIQEKRGEEIKKKQKRGVRCSGESQTKSGVKIKKRSLRWDETQITERIMVVQQINVATWKIFDPLLQSQSICIGCTWPQYLWKV